MNTIYHLSIGSTLTLTRCLSLVLSTSRTINYMSKEQAKTYITIDRSGLANGEKKTAKVGPCTLTVTGPLMNRRHGINVLVVLAMLVGFISTLFVLTDLYQLRVKVSWAILGRSRAPKFAVKKLAKSDIFMWLQSATLNDKILVSGFVISQTRSITLATPGPI